MFNVRFCVTGFLFLRARLSLRSTLGLEQKGLGGRVKPEERLDFQPHLRRVHPPSNALFGKVLNSPGCESWCLSSARCLPPPVKALSHSIMTGKGQNAASANCYFKGKGNRPPLTPTMVHILSQWGSLMCEQGSGRAVNRAFYQAARGELGCQWRGLSRVCHVPTLALACLFWWQHETGVTAGLVYTGYMSSRRARSPWETHLWDCIRTPGVVHLGTQVYTGGTRIDRSFWWLYQMQYITPKTKRENGIKSLRKAK